MRAWLWLAAVLVSTGLSSAAAQDARPARLLTRPDAQAFTDNFPVVALARGVSGRAVLECAVTADGGSQCTAAEETPEGMGFGAAAVALSQGWRFRPHTEGGQPTASVARVPVEFQNPTTELTPINSRINVDGVRGFDQQPEEGDDHTHLAQYYPERALQGAGVDGRALVACTVRTDHHLECALESEYPAGYGFGERTVALLTEHLSEAGQTLDVGATGRFVVDFALHDPGRPATVRDYFATRPGARDYWRYYPDRAINQEIGGSTILFCTIGADAKLTCSVGAESPPGWGFGAAALNISRSFQLNPEVLGRPGFVVGDRMQVPVNFRVHS